jgi:epoxyqueuosine reductase QueG
MVAAADTRTQYRRPLVGFAPADAPGFAELHHAVHPTHLLPHDMLPGARSVVSFFLPFAPWVVEANAQHRKQVADEWAVAYVETNDLIGRITACLIEALAQCGIRAAAEPATYNFDPVTLVSRWAHKSVAVIAGIGSFGLHQLIITDAGCAGRFGSLVLDADLPATKAEPKHRCLYFHDGSCLECVMRCPADALDPSEPLDKQSCWQRCQDVGEEFKHLGPTEVCGKCATGPCSAESAVP